MILMQRYEQVFLFLINIFLLTNLNEGETVRSSYIDIIPNIAVLNSTSITNFLCINHHPTDHRPLMARLIKNISKDQLEIERYQLNKTTIQIRMESKNYIGILHLFCYLKNKTSEGIRADVIIKSAPGSILLVEQCHVYDRKYIKCIFRTTVIARAIQNDFPPTFEFREISDTFAYRPNYQFLKNESTNEYLVFLWRLTTDGEYPNSILMNMIIQLPYFDQLEYRFDMSPKIAIKTNFTLKKVRQNKIQIQLAPLSSSVICEQSITPTTNSNIAQTWTALESTQEKIVISDLLYNTTYQICIRCGYISNDPYSIENCQEMRTSNKFCILCMESLIMVTVICSFVLVLIFGVIYFLHKRKPSPRLSREPSPMPDESVLQDLVNTGNDQGGYDLVYPKNHTN